MRRSAILIATLILVAFPLDHASATNPGANGFLAFNRCRSGSCSIWTMQGDLTHRERLAALDGDVSELAWSADGARVAFVRSLGRREAIVVADSDGSNDRRIYAQSGAATVYDLSWSPTGRRILATRVAGNPYTSPLHYEILIVNVATGAVTIPTKAVPGDQAFADWSNDGEDLAFLHRFTSYATLDLLTSDLHRVYTPYQTFSGPSWSPDGSRLAIGAQPTSHGPYEIVLADVTGGGLVSFPYDAPAGATYDLYNTVWSPDGATVAFTVFFYNPITTSIATLDAADGGNQQTWTAPERVFVSSTSWQPVLP